MPAAAAAGTSQFASHHAPVTAPRQKKFFADRVTGTRRCSEFANANPAQPNFGETVMTPIKTATTLAATAASLALAALASAATPPAGSTGAAVNGADTVHCYGVNSCKGTADCKTTAHECKGMNECKGHGFKAMAANMCLKRGGTIGDLN